MPTGVYVHRPHTPESRRKISEAQRRRFAATETILRNERHPRWKGPNASASALHKWLHRHHPLTGVCGDCGAIGATEYAFLRHPETYTRKRDDYRELCRSCHRTFDYERRRTMASQENKEGIEPFEQSFYSKGDEAQTNHDSGSRSEGTDRGFEDFPGKRDNGPTFEGTHGS